MKEKGGGMSESEKQSLDWKRLITTIVLTVLIIGVARFTLWQFARGYGPGHDQGTSFMSYAGPVFPMTLLESMEGLTVERTVDFDFSPYQAKEEIGGDEEGESQAYLSYSYESFVTDDYQIENTSDQSIKVVGIYPFAGSLEDIEKIVPKIYVGGQRVATDIHPGPYPRNPQTLDSWQAYQTLLADGGYMSRAFEELPVLSEKVIVYEFSDMVADLDMLEGENPTLRMDFEMDYIKTQVLTYGAYGAIFDPDNNYAARDFSLSRLGSGEDSRLSYLIVLGDDISDYTLQAYKNGQGRDDEKLEGVKVTIKRDERVLGEVLRDITYQYKNLFDKSEEKRLMDYLSDEEVLGLGLEFISDLGLISDGVTNQNMVMLEDVFSGTKNTERVFYLSYDIRIPAGKTETVSAQMLKPLSHDFAGSRRKNLNVDAYELVTRLGSNILFTKQKASIKDHGLIDIVRQNYGFDLEKDVKLVTLDTNEPHYFLEVRAKKDRKKGF